ncbi:MAG: NO-inducible flavohemoprotein [Byssovorax sp.]
MTKSNLSQQTIDIVQATAPVIRDHGVTIVSVMYRNMFRDNPEVKPYFNQANQSFGENKTRASQVEAFNDQAFSATPQVGSQAVSLTQAVFAYAQNIDNLGALAPAVLRIAHKHASLHILPEHYPIVGKHLLGAIKEVLGDAATDEIIEAWRDAFGFLAGILIGFENKLREESAGKVGGWQGFRECIVEKKVKESDEVYSFYLKPRDGGPLPPYKAGQYTCFRLDIPGHGVIYRCYTLSSGPGKEHFRVSIKRERGAQSYPNGVCSSYFHDGVREGDVLELAPPYGDLTLVETARPHVFIAAGIGITPMFSMFQSAVEARLPQKIYFLQAMRNGRLHPLENEVRELARANPTVTLRTFYSQAGPDDKLGEDYDVAGHLTLEQLQAVVPDGECEFYFTGPVTFMRAMRVALRRWNVPAERIHYECFGPMAAEIEAP